MPKPSAVVIGGGFGGLAAAIRLQAGGCDVTLVEKRDKLGGRAYVYEDQGFTFDAGPTVITAPHCIEELFEIAGRRIEDYVDLLPVTPLYRLNWEDGYSFNYTADLSETLKQIAEKCPQDVEGYRKFLKYTEEVFQRGYTELAHVPFLHWSAMVKVSPQLLKLRAYQNVYSTVARFLSDRHLREAFSFHSLLVGGNPFETSAIYTLIHFLERKWGVFFPRGGTGALVRGLEKLFLDLGGKVQTGAEVEEIVVSQGRTQGVLLRGTSQPIACSAVVSNADVHETYARLLRKVPTLERTRKRLAKARYSMSLFVLYFGTNRRFPGVAHHNILFGKRYKELLGDIFHRGHLADDFSLYLHAPTVTDPSLAPAGCEAFYVLSPVPHLGKGAIDWNVEGPRYAERILEYLEKHYLPDLRSSIVTQRIFTPLDFKQELNAHLGSAFSLEPILRQSAYFRVHNRDANVGGLYFTGAGTHPGAGIPGVISSSKATASLVLEDLRAEVPRYSASLQTASRKSIQVGSLSFSLASRLFEPERRDAASLLYSWCRHCDDKIDEARQPAVQQTNLEALREKTAAAFRGEPQESPVFEALRYVAHRYGIPQRYATDLLDGMEMDVCHQDFETLEDLNLYAYRVAGTVGLMMSHIMGVSDEAALAHARDLGIAMQLTNIARDVLQDYSRGRIYLPLAWLREAGIPRDSLDAPQYREKLSQVTNRLLTEADEYYASGRRGLRFLSFRCAVAVAAASGIYQQIGVLVRQRGAKAWDTRAIVSTPRKLRMVVRGALLALGSTPARILRVVRPGSPQFILRHT